MRIRGLQPEAIAKLLLGRAPAIDPDQPLRVFYCVADHYEPMWQGAGERLQRERVERWRTGLPSLLDGFRDSAGRKPKHTFFYPEEEYRPEYLDTLVELCEAGWGDVEVHLHHDNDTAENLRETLLRFTEKLHTQHGLLAPRGDGTYSYGFIHGNWTLDNSHPDGRWCGVNNELDVLRETGCYADFTLPAAPSPAQTVTVNSIYYATDDPERPKSHDRGVAAAVGRGPADDTLLMVQGPLVVDWTNRIRGLVPRIDYCNLQGRRAATLPRLLRWVDAGVVVRGQPNWRFVKVHTHGCEEGNAEILLGEPMRRFHEDLAEHARKTPDFEYYYVTAREMASLVHQAEQGATEPVFPTSEPDRAAQAASASTSSSAADQSATIREDAAQSASKSSSVRS